MTVRGLPAEFVRYPTADGLMLHGLLWEPAESSPIAVVYVPGFGGGFAGPSDIGSFAACLTRAGCNMLAINTRAVSPTGMVFARFEDCIADIDAALAFLRNRGMSSIVLVGDSLGACRVAYYLANNAAEDVAGAVFLGGIVSPYAEAQMRWNDADRARFDAFLEAARSRIADGFGKEVVSFPWGGGRPLTVSAETLVNVFGAPGDGNTHLPSHAGSVRVPALVLHGSRDAVSLPENASQIWEALAEAPSRELIMVDADHFFMSQADARAYADILVEWLGGLPAHRAACENRSAKLGTTA